MTVAERNRLTAEITRLRAQVDKWLDKACENNALRMTAEAAEEIFRTSNAALTSEVLSLRAERDALREQLSSAVRIAEEARQEWDAAPSGMRAGKILIALSGGCKGYRPDTDAIHAALAAVTAGEKPC